MPEYSDLIGKPFKEFARGPEAYDCLGLVIEVYRRNGKWFPDYGDIPAFAGTHVADRMDQHRHEFLAIDGPCPLAVVEFCTRDHIGVVVDQGWILHANTRGVQRLRIDSQITKAIVRGYWWLKEA